MLPTVTGQARFSRIDVMTIRVLIFASLAQRLGVRELSLPLPEQATVGNAMDELVRQFSDLAPLRPQVATAVNMAYVGPGHKLADGDELALIPPVSGG
jgi:MoaE-MoaD fusion protein